MQLEDLEKFAHTSRQVYRISQPQLLEHRRLVRKYRSFKNLRFQDEVREGGLRGPIPELLREVLENPQIGRYVREVAFDTLENIPFDIEDHDAWTEEEMEEEMKRYSQQLDLFNTVALQSEFLAKPRRIGWTWGDTIGEDQDEVIPVVLLLPLLPNLTSLSWARGMI